MEFNLAAYQTFTSYNLLAVLYRDRKISRAIGMLGGVPVRSINAMRAEDTAKATQNLERSFDRVEETVPITGSDRPSNDLVNLDFVLSTLSVFYVRQGRQYGANVETFSEHLQGFMRFSCPNIPSHNELGQQLQISSSVKCLSSYVARLSQRGRSSIAVSQASSKGTPLREAETSCTIVHQNRRQTRSLLGFFRWGMMLTPGVSSLCGLGVV